MTRRVAALVTVFNRRDKTLLGLRSLRTAALRAEWTLTIYLVDDGSTDGTAEAVEAEFPGARVIRHAGGLYWCRGMYLAWMTALPGDYDAYLWFNDDGQLAPDSLARVESLAQSRHDEGRPAVIVGTFVDPATGNVTYGGRRVVSRWRRTRTELVPLAPGPQSCDTMNGNLVLVGREVVRRIGIIDNGFEHAMGDTDYGLRARAAGFEVLTCPGAVGTCARNATRGTFDDPNLPLARRWRHMMSPKGLPPRSWARWTRRHAGPAWPVYFVFPYARVLVSGLIGAGLRRRADARSEARP